MVGRCGSGTNVVVALVTLWAIVISVQCTSEQHDNKNQTLDEILDNVTEVATHPEFCVLPFRDSYRLLSIPMDTRRFREAQQNVDFIGRFLQDSETFDNKKVINAILKNIIESEHSIYMARLLLPSPEEKTKYLMTFYRRAKRYHHRTSEHKEILYSFNEVQNEGPWWGDGELLSKGPAEVTPSDNATCHWSNPYYWCERNKWLVTYSCSFFKTKNGNLHKKPLSERAGHFAVDFDITHLDINQCDPLSNDTAGAISQIRIFVGTHKCDSRSSECIFSPGGGWTKGSYICRCKDGFYSTNGSPLFNGSHLEVAYRSSRLTHPVLYVCRECAPGCGTCTDASPCLSEYNWYFRVPLLIISMVCILFTLLLIGYIYHYRKLKVIKVASPIFLCITLLGAVIMYLEMAAIFPVLDMYSCVATKWTRHLGFCITYSALLLKTWRVSLTYRVKSAHKIKLTDKQLLQWLFPILLVMVIYLSTWTVSSPPEAEYIKDFNNLQFKQCTYNWWDHCLAIGEVFFLLWGIKVCYNVRNAESFFNEAKHISYAIYNIAIVNIIMVAIHLLIFPNAPPDIKYLFGFIRTQLSTTVTICFVFGPKFYRVLKGQGDVYDNRARARGVTASFSLNGIGLMHEETTDLYQENEELKEEIQKLASNIEFMKVVHMETINRHVKLKQGGYFSQCAINATHSPIPKAIYMKFESSDSPTSRISPAAELMSERV